MRYRFRFFLIISIFLLISCQTSQQTSESSESGSFEEDVASAIGEDSMWGAGGDDLESEFVDSEDFEKDILNESSLEEDFEQADLKKEFSEQKKEASLEKESADSQDLLVDEDELPEDTENDQKQEVADNDSEEMELLGDGDIISDNGEEDNQTDGPTKELASEEDASSPVLSEQETVDEAGDSPEEQLTQEELPGEQISEGDLPLETPPKSAASRSVITNIRYVASENTIYIDSAKELSYQSRENTINNQHIIEIENAVLSDSLKWPFIMKDFDTQMVFLKADQKDSNTVRVVIQMRRGSNESPSFSTSDSGSLMVSSPVISYPTTSFSGEEVTDDDNFSEVGGTNQSSGEESASLIMKAKTIEEFLTSNPKFTGSPISIHLQDVEVRDVLYFISEGTGLNMVVDDDVKGSISIKLRQVPWDQALVTIMKTKRLGYVREGNVIRIMTIASLKKDQSDFEAMLKAQEKLEPLVTEEVAVEYAKAQDLVSTISSFLTDRGKVIVNEQKNTLFITDIQTIVDQIKLQITGVDQSPKQVMIEAKIVEARESFTRNLGFSWGYTSSGSTNLFGNPQLSLDIGGGIESFPATRAGGGTSGGGRTLSAPFHLYLGSIAQLNAILGLSEEEGIARVISAPRVMVINGEKAKISQSTETISVSTQQSPSGETLGTSAQRTPIQLDFEVKPQITEAGSVFMEIKMKRQFPGHVQDPSTQARAVNSREIETKVLIKNGQTIVIGGIYQEDKTKSDEGIPILRDIPILKWLFSRRTSDSARNELLLFLTPKVINDLENAEKPS